MINFYSSFIKRIADVIIALIVSFFFIPLIILIAMILFFIYDKKVFYKANLNHHDDYGDQIDNYQVFPFKTVINLSPGINQISVFSRGRHGFTSERKLRMLKRH